MDFRNCTLRDELRSISLFFHAAGVLRLMSFGVRMMEGQNAKKPFKSERWRKRERERRHS